MKSLVVAHQHITPVTKDRTNTYYSNKYATLDNILETIRPILFGHGLMIVQGGVDAPKGSIAVETLLAHISGEWISSVYTVPLTPIGKKGEVTEPTAQAAGSAITYARRYGVSSMLALATEDDDDGNDASKTGPYAPEATQSQPTPKSAPASMEPVCPKCGGACWDNRQENDARLAKGERLRPDWSCKDKGKCDGVIWRPK